MKRRKGVALVVLAIVLVALVLAVPVVARATRTEFEGEWFPIDLTGIPERSWEPGGRWQARGWPITVEVFDTDNPLVDGVWDMVFDNHYDALWAGPWNGTVYGEVFCSDGTLGFWDGTFTGKTPGYLAGLGGTSYVRAKGSGCVKGMKIHFEIYNLAGEEFGIMGYILDPHGE